MCKSGAPKLWLSLILLAGIANLTGCGGDPQVGTISKPKNAPALDPGRPGGTPEPPPKRPSKAKDQPSDELIKNPKLRG